MTIMTLQFNDGRMYAEHNTWFRQVSSWHQTTYSKPGGIQQNLNRYNLSTLFDRSLKHIYIYVYMVRMRSYEWEMFKYRDVERRKYKNNGSLKIRGWRILLEIGRMKAISYFLVNLYWIFIWMHSSYYSEYFPHCIR